jgi:hypothetical protein
VLLEICGVEVWRGGLGWAYRWPILSAVGASLSPPCFRFHTPLIEPDMRFCRIQFPEKVPRCHPRKSVGPSGQTDYAHLIVEKDVRRVLEKSDGRDWQPTSYLHGDYGKAMDLSRTSTRSST